MNLFCWHANKFKCCGITLCKVKNTAKGVRVYLLGIPLCVVRTKLSQFFTEVKNNRDFDVRRFDAQISEMVAGQKTVKCRSDKHKLLFWQQLFMTWVDIPSVSGIWRCLCLIVMRKHYF